METNPSPLRRSFLEEQNLLDEISFLDDTTLRLLDQRIAVVQRQFFKFMIFLDELNPRHRAALLHVLARHVSNAVFELHSIGVQHLTPEDRRPVEFPINAFAVVSHGTNP
jgi:hypothetical protein